MPLKRPSYLPKEALEKYMNSKEFNKTADNTIDAISDDETADEGVCGTYVLFHSHPQPTPYLLPLVRLPSYYRQ